MKKILVLVAMVIIAISYVGVCNLSKENKKETVQNESELVENKPVSAENFKKVMEKDGYIVNSTIEQETILSYSASNENKTVADFHMYILEYENITDAQAVYCSLIKDYTDYEYSDNLTITQYDDGVRKMYKLTSKPSYYIAVLNNNTIMIVNSVDTEKEVVAKYLKQFNFYVDETKYLLPEKPSDK